MAFRLTDTEAEQFVLSRGLATPEQLTPFRVQCSVDSSSLFDLLIAEKLITPEMLQELEKSAPPPPPPRSIRSGGTGFLSRQSAPAVPAISGSDAVAAESGAQAGVSNGSINAANSGANPGVGGARRPSRTRMFEEPGSAGASSSQNHPAVKPPSAAAMPSVGSGHHSQVRQRCRRSEAGIIRKCLNSSTILPACSRPPSFHSSSAGPTAGRAARPRRIPRPGTSSSG
jgi:hypothetical protein